MKPTVLALLVLSASSIPVFSETIYLRDGSQIHGQINIATFSVETEKGVLPIRKDQIQRIEFAAPKAKEPGSAKHLKQAGTTAIVAAAKQEQKEQIENRFPTQGDLGAIQAALSVYHDDHKKYPATLDELTVEGKYLRIVPGKKFLEYDSRTGDVIAKLRK